MPKFFVTTAIPYVNARPHIGYAMELAQADVIARYRRINGYDTFLCTGTDENSLKNALAAEKLGVKTEELCEANFALFKELADKIEFSYDAFVRTHADREHWAVAEELWKACAKSGDIYKKKYKGFYCVGCEVFYTEMELVDGLCPEHKTKPELIEEENYFFRLSKYQKELERLVEGGELKVIPDSRKMESLNFIKSGLEDFSISRSVKRAHGWGIPVPGDAEQIMYVWFDALANYLTAAGLISDKNKFTKLWPPDVQVIGKGISRFHVIYWPAMLLSGGFALPKAVFIHGYITVEGQKMSKSIGNVIDPIDVIRKYGAEPLRYYLLKEISTFEDGDFSEKTLKDSINNELVGNFGNFINRTLSFITTKFGGQIEEQKLGEKDIAVLNEVSAMADEMKSLLERYQLNQALLKMLEISGVGNRYFQNSEPWKLIKEDEAAAKKILFVCANICRTLGIIAYPYMPNASEALLGYLNARPASFDETKNMVKKFAVNPPKILFNKIE